MGGQRRTVAPHSEHVVVRVSDVAHLGTPQRVMEPTIIDQDSTADGLRAAWAECALCKTLFDLGLWPGNPHLTNNPEVQQEVEEHYRQLLERKQLACPFFLERRPNGHCLQRLCR